MNFFLNKLKPASPIDEIEDPEVVEKEYTHWRYRTLYSIFTGYALYYFTRKSFTIAMPGLMEELNLDMAQLGLLGTIFSLTYGVSKFTSGMLSDCLSPRYFMALGLICTGVCNILFGLSSSLILFSLLWGMNGWFQAFGAPPCIRFLTQWYSHSERGSWWSSWSMSHNVGSFLVMWGAGWCLQYLGWRYALYLPGLLCIGGGFFLINRLRDTPQSIGLPAIEKYRNDYADITNKTESKPGFWPTFKKYILNNPYIWLLAIAYFFLYAIRIGIADWTALHLINNKGYDRLIATGTVSLFEIGGLIGGLCAGWSSDRLFGARRGPVNVLYAVAIVGALLFFRAIPANNFMLDSIAIFMLGFTIFGPQVLIGVAAAELAHKDAAASSNGFIGLGAYLGAALAGYPLGRISRDFGTEGFFWSLVICAVISAAVLLPMWRVTKAKQQLVPAEIKA